MSAFDDKLKQREKSFDRRIEYKNTEVPTYGAKGKVVKAEKKKHILLPIIFLIVAGIVLIVYVPSLFMHDTVDENNYLVNVDTTASSYMNTYIKENAKLDIDGDGLVNNQEMTYGTISRKPDTDGDGVCDSAEINITNTDPTVFDDCLYKVIKEKDAAEGTVVNAPYKIHDVVLWPDDMTSRTYGGVVQTINGYRFTNFKGWAQFPTGTYAYKITNGKHVKLEYKQIENAWYIDTTDEIVLTDSELEMVNKLTVFGNVFYLDDSFLGNLLSSILPSQNYTFACEKVARIDTYENINNAIVTPVEILTYNPENIEIYGSNTNSLEDLTRVYRTIDEGRPLLANLFSSTKGSSVVEVYGYDENGNLLIADPNTMETIGVISITVKGSRYMEADGTLTQREWFSYTGAGFSSSDGDYINFFTSTETTEEAEIETEVSETETNEATETSENAEDTAEAETTTSITSSDDVENTTTAEETETTIQTETETEPAIVTETEITE